MENLKNLIFFSGIICFSTSTIAKEKSYSIVEVNDHWNKQIDYQEELGYKEDKWQTPQETFNFKYGDCEDYAIIKYFDLISKGANPEDLSIAFVLMKDPFEKKSKIKTHAVLLYKQNNKEYVLDNYSRDIVDLEKRIDIIKILSILKHNEAIIKSDKANMFMLKWAKLKTNFEQHVFFMKTIKTS